MQLPAGDLHFTKDHYQDTQQQMAYKLCVSFRRAIDAGAHVGYWSKNMVKLFHTVVAFEPDKANQVCFRHNVPLAILFEWALGETCELCHVVIDEITNSGAKHIEDGGIIPVIPLDLFKFKDVDLIKIDTQGYELPILKGAAKTIALTHPVLVVEMPKRGGDPNIESLLASWGYVVKHKYLADWIFV